MASLPTVVVGGGIIGLACAYDLDLAGHDVAIFDRASLGTGSSRGNAGWITMSHCYPVPSPGSVRAAVRSAGRADAPLYVRPSPSPHFLRWLYEFQKSCRPAAFQRGAAALGALAQPTEKLLENWRDDGIDMQLTRPGLVHAFLDEAEAERTLALQRSLASGRYDVPDEPETGSRIQRLEPALSDAVRAAYIVEHEGLVDPSRLLDSVARRLAARGVAIHERSAVSRFLTERGRVRGLIVNGVTVECAAVVIAGGTWSASLLSSLGVHVRMQAGKGYSFTADLPVPPQHPLYLGDKHVAISPLGGSTRISGTMEFSGNNRRLDWRRVEAIATASRDYLGRWFDQADELMGLINAPWVGGRPMLPDGLPLIDRVPALSNAYVATAHGMLGVTLAPATAAALAGFIVTGARPPVLEPFAFARIAGGTRTTPAGTC
jgi:glycine/D-amino acid oxidase-like deaminating enzyme